MKWSKLMKDIYYTWMCLEVDFGSVERRYHSFGESSGSGSGWQRCQDTSAVTILQTNTFLHLQCKSNTMFSKVQIY